MQFSLFPNDANVSAHVDIWDLRRLASEEHSQAYMSLESSPFQCGPKKSWTQTWNLFLFIYGPEQHGEGGSVALVFGVQIKNYNSWFISIFLNPCQHSASAASDNAAVQTLRCEKERQHFYIWGRWIPACVPLFTILSLFCSWGWRRGCSRLLHAVEPGDVGRSRLGESPTRSENAGTGTVNIHAYSG